MSRLNDDLKVLQREYQVYLDAQLNPSSGAEGGQEAVLSMSKKLDNLLRFEKNLGPEVNTETGNEIRKLQSAIEGLAKERQDKIDKYNRQVQERQLKGLGDGDRNIDQNDPLGVDRGGIRTPDETKNIQTPQPDVNRPHQ